MMKKFIFFTLLIVFFSYPAFANTPIYAEKQVIVGIVAPQISDMDIITYSQVILKQAEDFAEKFGLIVISTYPEIARASGINIIALRSENKSTEELLQELSSVPEVLGISPNYIVYLPDPFLSLNKTVTTIHVGNTEQLIATVRPADRPLTWSSSNTDVVSVDNSGLVYAISVGTAMISVRDVERSLIVACIVTVIDETIAIPLHVTLNKAMANIQVGVTEQLYANLVPNIAIYVPLTWSSSNPAVATVSATGLVTGISAGTAAITVSMENGINATCIFDVSEEAIPLPPYVLLNKVTANIKTGNTEKLVATTSPADRPLTWSSSNPSVATVNDSGFVTGISIGTAKITASIEGGIPMACMVAVSDSGDNEHSSGGGGCEALNFGVLGFSLAFAFFAKRRRIS